MPCPYFFACFALNPGSRAHPTKHKKLGSFTTDALKRKGDRRSPLQVVVLPLLYCFQKQSRLRCGALFGMEDQMATKRYNAGIQRAKGLLEIAAGLYDSSLSHETMRAAEGM